MVNFDARNDEIDSPLLTLLYLSRLQKEREAFEVIVDNGKLVYRHSGKLVNTTEGSKWIFCPMYLEKYVCSKKEERQVSTLEFSRWRSYHYSWKTGRP